MKQEDLFSPAADWSGETWAGRIDQCASMLFVHGYIPQAVRAKIADKLLKQCRAAQGTEAQRAETSSGSVHDGDAQ